MLAQRKSIAHDYWGCRTCTMLNEAASATCAFCLESKTATAASFTPKSSKKSAQVPHWNHDAAPAAIGYDERMLLHVQPQRGPNGSDKEGGAGGGGKKSRSEAGSDEDVVYIAEDDSDEDDVDDDAAVHPERPDRIRSVFKYLQAQGLLANVLRIPGREATRSELVAVHSNDHIARINNMTKPLRHMDENGAYCCPETPNAASIAVGCAAARGPGRQSTMPSPSHDTGRPYSTGNSAVGGGGAVCGVWCGGVCGCVGRRRRHRNVTVRALRAGVRSTRSPR